MYINFEILQQYLEKRGCTVNISIDTDDSLLRFTLGRAKDYGSRVELMCAKDLMDILTLNDIIGEGSQVQVILSTPRNQRRDDYDLQIEELIYGTLSKYIVRLFYPSVAKNPFPDLKWLSIHAHHYVAE